MSGSNHLFHTVNALLSALFQKEEANQARRETSLIARNTQLGGSSDGFRHLGVIYTELTGPARSRGAYARLHSSLLVEMDELLKERVTIANDKDRIRQALTLTLRGCKTFQDMRDALPNGVKDFIPELRQLERTRPEAFTLADNPRSYNQYMKLRDKIDYYVASQLIY